MAGCCAAWCVSVAPPALPLFRAALFPASCCCGSASLRVTAAPKGGQRLKGPASLWSRFDPCLRHLPRPGIPIPALRLAGYSRPCGVWGRAAPVDAGSRFASLTSAACPLLPRAGGLIPLGGKPVWLHKVQQRCQRADGRHRVIGCVVDALAAILPLHGVQP